MADKKATIVIKKKKGGGHGGAHGGAWKVAYADFVTAMMCFFLVMWLMGADEETKKAVEHYFNHPNTPYKQGKDPNADIIKPLGDNTAEGESILNGLEGLQPDDLTPAEVKPTTKPQSEHAEMKELVEEQMDNQAYAFDVQVEYLKFSLPEGLFFRPGEYKLAPDASKYLGRIGQIIKGYKGYVNIAAHVDDSPDARGKRDGYEFSTARAVSIMNALVEKNYISDERVYAAGMGSKRSIASNETVEGRNKNRRIEFTLSLEKPR